MEFEYKVTVIIPVYNMEQYLKVCLDSLLAQTIPQCEMEVLMINDGSQDESLAICERYTEHPNFKVISQENQGVSAARNTGIRSAKGKYLLYLDGDDELSPETVKNVTDFFDEHYDEVDVVTYQLVYRKEDGESSHWRYRYLKNSGVYDLEKYPYVSQTTMNICVKNQGKNNIFFDTQLKRYEDQIYNLTQVISHNQIGYCKNARYFYYQRNTGTTKQNSHPFYEGVFLLEIFERLLAIGERSKYSQALILYDLNWRIRGDLIYPYHFSKEDFEKYRLRLSEVINQIDSKLILYHPFIDQVHKWYLLSLKTRQRPFVIAEPKAVVMSSTEGELGRFSNVLMVITRSSVEKGQLHMTAYMKSLYLPFLDEKAKILAIINGKETIQLDTFLSSHSKYWTRMQVAEFPAFHFDISLKDVSDISFQFHICGYSYPIRMWGMKTQGLQQEDKQYYLTDGRYRVYIQDNTLRVQKGLFPVSQPKANRKITLCRALMGHRAKRVWLYSDRQGTFDNAYFQFCHDFGKNDGVERYYIYDGELTSVEKRFTEKQKKYLVPLQSYRHKILYGNAEYILTSFIDTIYYRPFDDNTFALYRGKCKGKVVYLQHGVLHAQSIQYSKERQETDKVVVSGEYEKDLFVHACGFQPGDLIETGMPRLDTLRRDTAPKKKILYAPSWRTYLSDGLVNLRWQPVPEEKLRKSNYFRGIVGLMKNEELRKKLKKNGYTIEIKLHPIFEMYTDIFSRELPDINFQVGNVDLEEYAAFITDFSSFLFDFAYLNRAIFYYVPDIQEFRSGLNGYRELYIPFEEGLGKFSTDEQEIAREIIKAMDRGFVMEPQYKERADKIFSSYEANHADALYNALMRGDSDR